MQWAALAAVAAAAGFSQHWPLLGWFGVLVVGLSLRLALVASRDGSYRQALSGCLFPGLLLLVGAAWLIAVGVRFVTIIAKGSAYGPLADVAALLVVAALHIGSELLYARAILRFMGEKTDAVPPRREHEVASLDRPLGGPVIVEYDATSDLPIDELGDRFAARLERPGALHMYRGLLLTLGASAAVTVVVSCYLSWHAPLAFVQDVFELKGTAARATMCVWLVRFQAPSILLAFALAAAVKYVRGRTGWMTALLCLAVANVSKLALTGAITLNDKPFVPMTGPGVAPMLAAAPAMALTVMLTFSCLEWRRARRNIRGRTVVDRRLLVLRVFGIFTNTRSLFQDIAERWQSSGPVFTIADPGYAKFEFARGRFLVLLFALTPLVLFLPFIASDAHASMGFIGFYGPAFVAIYIPTLLIYSAAQTLSLRTRFARNVDAVRQTIVFESDEETSLSHRYKQGIAYCYDDIWKAALDELVSWSDVILMDLRGFDQLRKGCQYELDFLIDRFPLERALFLVDDSTDRQLVTEVLNESWRQTEPSSPNRLSGVPPTITLYRASNKLRKDLPRLVGLLGRVAARVSDSAPRSKAIAQLEQRTRWLRRAAPAAASLIGVGVLLQLAIAADVLGWAFGQNGLSTFSGLSLAWLGIILWMLARRVEMLLQRDGNPRRIFQGFPWPQVFWMITAPWLLIHLFVLS